MAYLSPIDEYSDFAFRMLCQKYGAASACVPLVNSLAVLQGKLSDVDAVPEEKNVGVQIVGSEPEAVGKALGIIRKKAPFVSWFNLNCGCPSTRTVGSGGGSALLAHPEKITGAVREMKKNDVQVSVKLRIKRDAAETAKLCAEIEGAGADFIILHGRTPGQAYGGLADWDAIKTVRESIGIPLIGNGDIQSASQGKEYVRGGFCDDFMVGRAAMSNPMLFCDREPEGYSARLGLLEEYVEIHRRYCEPRVRDVRAKAVQFISGVSGASRRRDGLSRAKSTEEIFSLLGRGESGDG